jgi:hypothetical protein
MRRLEMAGTALGWVVVIGAIAYFTLRTIL